LVAHGLVRPSFVPRAKIRRLRDLTRLRKAQINERGRSIQRLEKILQDGIKLTPEPGPTSASSPPKPADAQTRAPTRGFTGQRLSVSAPVKRARSGGSFGGVRSGVSGGGLELADGEEK
jgi:hypothetical protein